VFTIIAKQGLDVSPYTKVQKEKEFLLNHNTPVKVHKVAETANGWEITVEQILEVANAG
jgi:hypothetical protein